MMSSNEAVVVNFSTHFQSEVLPITHVPSGSMADNFATIVRLDDHGFVTIGRLDLRQAQILEEFVGKVKHVNSFFTFVFNLGCLHVKQNRIQW